MFQKNCEFGNVNPNRMWEIPYICLCAILAERIQVARELQDTILQTVQGSKFVVDEALEKSDDAVHMRLALERLSIWLGQATQEGQAALNALNISCPVENPVPDLPIPAEESLQ